MFRRKTHEIDRFVIFAYFDLGNWKNVNLTSHVFFMLAPVRVHLLQFISYKITASRGCLAQRISVHFVKILLQGTVVRNTPYAVFLSKRDLSLPYILHLCLTPILKNVSAFWSCFKCFKNNCRRSIHPLSAREWSLSKLALWLEGSEYSSTQHYNQHCNLLKQCQLSSLTYGGVTAMIV